MNINQKLGIEARREGNILPNQGEIHSTHKSRKDSSVSAEHTHNDQGSTPSPSSDGYCNSRSRSIESKSITIRITRTDGNDTPPGKKKDIAISSFGDMEAFHEQRKNYTKATKHLSFCFQIE